ncbi:hypothetical protein FACS189499_08810 [Clostridia bacterium]|nr:hypothetical protein FACS189499_08810 [Clostridia bacterium]
MSTREKCINIIYSFDEQHLERIYEYLESEKRRNNELYVAKLEESVQQAKNGEVYERRGGEFVKSSMEIKENMTQEEFAVNIGAAMKPLIDIINGKEKIPERGNIKEKLSSWQKMADN